MRGYAVMLCVLLTAFNADAGRITMSNPKQSTIDVNRPVLVPGIF